ncbi:MAG: hypothetical protein AB7R77_09615 [Ilumatobacteraceae bacterium]
MSKLVVGATASVGLVVGGTIAYAAWSASGAGGSQAKALTAQTLTVNAGTGAADLYPGFTGGDLFFSLTNANPYPVTPATMSPGSITSSDPTNCPASNVSATGKSGLSLNVGANATSGALSITDVVSMQASAPDGCQGVTFTIVINLTGAQA